MGHKLTIVGPGLNLLVALGIAAQALATDRHILCYFACTAKRFFTRSRLHVRHSVKRRVGEAGTLASTCLEFRAKPVRANYSLRDLFKHYEVRQPL